MTFGCQAHNPALNFMSAYKQITNGRIRWTTRNEMWQQISLASLQSCSMHGCSLIIWYSTKYLPHLFLPFVHKQSSTYLQICLFKGYITGVCFEMWEAPVAVFCGGIRSLHNSFTFQVVFDEFHVDFLCRKKIPNLSGYITTHIV